LICPVDFVEQAQIVFVRLQKAVELPGMLEIKLTTRFLVVLLGNESMEKHLLQLGRTIATILTDDICRDMAYVSTDFQGIMNMVDRFMQDTYVIPPSEWDPTIRIEPPMNYTSKVIVE
jgi:mannitol/fructose-specific phosphotransferase system IIA component (Ntr-type)